MATAERSRARPVDELFALADAARRVFGADCVVICERDTDGRPSVLTAAGFSARELHELQRGLVRAGSAHLDSAYETALHADAEHAGQPLGSIHVLHRAEVAFDHPELIRTFAAQSGLSIAMRRRPPLEEEWLRTWGVLDRLVLSVHSPAELSAALTDVVGPLFGGARCGVMIADTQRNVLQMIPGAFGSPEHVTASHRVSFFDPRSNSARVLTTGQPYISNTSEGDSGIRQEYVDVFRIHRLLTVPLRDVGVLHIANAEHDFELDDLERALALAPRIASIVELAIRLFGHHRRQRLEETLTAVAVAVASGDGIGDFLPAALKELCGATDAGLLALVSDDGPPVAARNGERREDLEAAVLEEAESEPGMRAYVVGPEEPGDPGWAAFYVPVHLGRTRVGTLAALRVRGEPFSRVEREAFVRLANLAALAYATERYQQQRAQVARLQERQRIADDLHDDVAQILFAAQLSLDDLLAEGVVGPDVAGRIERARALLIRGDTTIRNVIHKLSASAPAADLGTRLASVVAGIEDEFSIVVGLHVDERAAARARHLRRPAADALVKVARESLVNAAKHAGPCRVTARLELPRRDRLSLTVSDDGRGLARGNGAGHGLASLRSQMRDQGGSLRVSGGRPIGTRVVASLPLQPPAAGGADC